MLKIIIFIIHTLASLTLVRITLGQRQRYTQTYTLTYTVIEIHTQKQVILANPPTGMFWKVGGN